MLEDVVIPKKLTSIGSCAFLECSSLKNVVIPSSVTYISSRAFQSCDSLEKAFILGDPQFYIQENFYSFPIKASLSIYGILGSRTEEYCKKTGTRFIGIEVVDIISIDKQKKSIVLNWTKASNINNYNIYRKEDEDDSFEKIASVRGSSYQDTNVLNKKTYYYAIGVSYVFEDIVLENVMGKEQVIYYEYVKKPKKVPIIKLEKSKYQLKIKIKKQNAQYYQIQYSTSKKFLISETTTLTYGTESTSAVIYKSNFQIKKKYYIRIRAYNKDSEGNCYYSKWCDAKKIKFNK